MSEKVVCAEAEPPRSAVIVSMSPPGYPSAMVASLQSLLPFRLARSLYSGLRATDISAAPSGEREGTRETSPRASDLTKAHSLSEHQLQGELDNAWASRAGHFSERRSAECQSDGTGLTKIWSVHDVNEFRPELQIHSFPNAHVLKQRKVEIHQSGRTDHPIPSLPKKSPAAICELVGIANAAGLSQLLG